MKLSYPKRQSDTLILLLSVLVMGLTAMVSYAQTAKDLMAEIKTYTKVPVAERNFAAILELTTELCERFPESDDVFWMLDSVERWHSAGHISNEQFEPFKQRIQIRKQKDDKERAIAEKIDKQYMEFLDSSDRSSKACQRVVNACLDVLKLPEISAKLRYTMYFQIARVSFDTQQYEQFGKYAEYFINQSKRQSGLDFSGLESMVAEIKGMCIRKAIQDSDLNEQMQTWEKEINQANSVEDVIVRFREMNRMFEVTLLNTKPNTERYDIISQARTVFLEQFVQKFSDSANLEVLNARLVLGYHVMNQRSLSQGTYSAIMTTDQTNRIKSMEKEDAEQAEPHFVFLRERGKGTIYEESAIKALKEVERRKTPYLMPESEKIESYPIERSSSFTWRFWVFLVVNLIFLALIFRKIIVRIFATFFKKKEVMSINLFSNMHVIIFLTIFAFILQVWLIAQVVSEPVESTPPHSCPQCLGTDGYWNVSYPWFSKYFSVITNQKRSLVWGSIGGVLHNFPSDVAQPITRTTTEEVSLGYTSSIGGSQTTEIQAELGIKQTGAVGGGFTNESTWSLGVSKGSKKSVEMGRICPVGTAIWDRAYYYSRTIVGTRYRYNAGLRARYWCYLCYEYTREDRFTDFYDHV